MMKLVDLMNWMGLVGFTNWMGFVFDGQGLPCLFHLFTGFYCPGCGGTRAILLLLKGDVAGSIKYHPFVLYAVLVLAAELVIFLRSAAKNDLRENAQKMEKRYRLWTSIGVGIVLVNWGVKNVCLAAGIDLLPPI